MPESLLDFSAFAEEVENAFDSTQTDAPDFSARAEPADAGGVSGNWPDPHKIGLLPDTQPSAPKPVPTEPKRRARSTERTPASIRFSNPGAMYPGPSSRKFGATGTETIGGGHKIAVFPDAESGAAAQFDLLDRGYTGMSLQDALRKWSGGNNSEAYTAAVSRATGLAPDTLLTRDLVRDPTVAIPLAKAMARVEAGMDFPLSDEQWQRAHARAFGGAAPLPTQLAQATPAAPAAPAAPSAPKGDLLQRILSARPEDRAKVVEDYLYEMTGATRPQPLQPLDFSELAEPLDFSDQAEPVETAPKGERAKASFSDAFGRGVDIAQQLGFGAVEALGELTGLEGVTEFGREGRKRNVKEAEAYGPRAQFSDIGGIGDFIQWAKETAGEQIPIMLPSMGGFGVGAMAGAPFGPIGMTIGGMIGAFIPSFALGVGEVQSAIKDKDENAVAPGWAIAGGTAIAALDSVLPGMLGSRLVRAFGRETAEEIAKRALAKPVKEGWIKRGAKGAAEGMAVEGVTEAVQEAIGEVTAAQGAGKPVDWSSMAEQMLEAGAAGSLMGGLIGGPTAIVEGRDQGTQRLALPPPASQQTPSQQTPTQQTGAPAAAPAAGTSIEDDISVLIAAGWDIRRLAEMDPEELATEAAAARQRGITAPKAPDQPSAEPVKDLVAQARDMVDPKKPRRALWLPRASLEALVNNPKGQQELIKTLSGKAVSLDDFDGQGGLLVVPDDATAQWALDQRQSGRDMQEIIGELTGAGQGKPIDGTHAVQQVTPQGEVTRERLVTEDQIAATEQEFAEPGRDVRTVSPEEALKRREEEITAEQATQGDGSRSRPIKVQTAEDVDRAGQRAAEPTEAQAEAGNYRKGHARIGGLDISIETPKGGKRRGTSPDGTAWEVEMPAHYGYVKGTQGRDGDQVDVYVGDAIDSNRVWVVDQVDANTGKFDEHKAFLGFGSEDDVRAAYEMAFSDGRAADRFGGITEMSLDEFKQWLAKGKRTRPLTDVKKRQAEAEAAPAAEPAAEPAQAQEAPTPAGDVPTFAEVMDALPKDESGDPDVAMLANTIRETTGKRAWNQLSDDEKIAVWGKITGEAEPEPEPAEQEAETAPETGPSDSEVTSTDKADKSKDEFSASDTRRPKRYEGPPLSDEEIDAIVDAWKYIVETWRQPKPRSLTQYIIDNGGIVDRHGEVAHIAGGYKGRPGLIRKGGDTQPGMFGPSETTNSIDDWALRAWEAGFFPEKIERPTVQEFLDALRDDLHEGNVVRPEDQRWFEDQSVADQMAEELLDYGIRPNEFRTEASLRRFFGQKLDKAREGDSAEAPRDQAQEAAAAGDIPFDVEREPTAEEPEAPAEPTEEPASKQDRREAAQARRELNQLAKRLVGKDRAAWAKEAKRLRDLVEKIDAVYDETDLTRSTRASLQRLGLWDEPAAETAEPAEKPEASEQQKQPKDRGPDRLKDWSGIQITGYEGEVDADQHDQAFGSIKRAFLADARNYLVKVAKILEQRGFEPYPVEKQGRKGKRVEKGRAVTVNPGGPAVSGDVHLDMINGDGQGVHVTIGTALAGPNGGISLMARTQDRNKRSGPNQWWSVDFTAQELADRLEQLATGRTFQAEKPADEAESPPAKKPSRLGTTLETMPPQDKGKVKAAVDRVRGETDTGIHTEASGQTSIVPPPTTQEQIRAEADKRGRPTREQKPMDEGLFGTDKDQTDLVEMAKKPPERKLDEGGWSEGFRDPNLHMKLDADGEVLGSAMWDQNRPAKEAWVATDADGNVLGYAGSLADAKAIVDRHVEAQAEPTEAAPEPAEAQEGGEPWQLTQQEYVNQRERAYIEKRGGRVPDRTAFGIQSHAAQQHERSVRAAVKEGRPVAPEVLADYPDLAQRLDIANPLAPLVVVLRGEGFKNIVEARKFVKEAGIVLADASHKQIDETIESAVVAAARQIVSEGGTPDQIYKKLVELYGKQPNLGTRTATSVANQAYSTPVPLAYIASRLAGVDAADLVFEPTAGNGALLIEVRSPGKAFANEIDPARAAELRRQGFRVSTEDATDPALAEQIRDKEGGADAVIMNPPFGAVREGGKSKEWTIDDWTTTQVDHAIALQSLKAMTDNGRAVLIVGSVKADSVDERRKGYRAKAKREFFWRLYKDYNVTDHFTVSGDLYTKQGAGWPVDVIVIEGRGKSQRPLPAAQPPAIYDSWEALAEKLPDDTTADTTAPRRPDRPPRDAAEGGARPTVRDEAPSEAPGGRGTERLPTERDDDAGRVRGDRDRRKPADVRRGDDDGLPVEPAGGRDRRRAGEPAAPEQLGPRVEQRPKRVRGEEKGGQATYVPTSRARSLNTLIPVNMADAAETALSAIEKRHGQVDEFVAKRLGYPGGAKSNAFLNAFSAEQIDAIAAAIDNIERGAAFIIGDQTGIGKGRINAALLRYAIRQGKIPVLVTEKPDLYGDMWRDMRDIGFEEFLGREPRIFITNTGASIPLDEEALEWKQEADAAKEAGLPMPKRYGKFLTGGTAQKQIKDMDAIARGEGGYDVVFTTYDQMNTVKGQDTPRRDFLLRIAPDALISFDESHNAGGAGQSGWKKSGAPMNRAEFARELASMAWGVMFSSATYAKRPEVMDLYARTDMGKAVDKADELPELIARGGVPLQQIVASMLTQSGQYMRRERSFDGVEYALEGVPVDEEAYEHFSNAVRAIFKFDLEVTPIKKDIIKDILDEIGAATTKDQGLGNAGAHSISFGSVMHNIVNQMLLSIKADKVAERAIRAHKEGEKPVIALASTMEAFITDFVSGEGITFGDEIDLTFRDVLHRYLRRTLRITVKHPDNRKEYRQIPVDALPTHLQRMYRDTIDIINEGVYDGMPISPIDALRNKLTEAGLRVVEVTGRQTMIDYSGDKPVYTQRPKKERGPTGKRSSIAAFNRGDLDALIINRSGSTGVSMHASTAFKDKRRRRMIIAQAEANIDTHLQTLGRVHRTGQVIPPAYSQIAAEIPAEARPAAVLMKKMASLNANTTGARGSVFMAEAVDFINEIGDEVTANIIMENPELRRELGDPIKVDENNRVEIEDAARIVTGRLTLLPPKQQAELLDRITSTYTAELNHLDQLGENPLEAKTVDLQARTLDVTEIKPKQGDSPFLEAVNLERVSVKSQGRALPPDEVAGAVAEAMKVKRPDQDPAVSLRALETQGRAWAQKRMDEVGERARNFIDAEVATVSKDAREKTRERHEDTLRRWMATMQITYPGARVKLNMPAGEQVGVVISVTRPGKAKNPVAPGAWEVRIAVPSGEREFRFPMSKLFPPAVPKGDNEKGAEISADNTDFPKLMEMFEEARKEGREIRYMMTGNILAAFDQTGGRGRIVMFTTEDGQLKPGILMGREFSQEKFMEKRKVRLLTAAQIMRFFERAPDVEVKSTDGFVRLRKEHGEFELAINGSRQSGGKYFTDSRVREAIRPRELERRKGMMVAEDVPPRKFEAAIERIIEIGALFEVREAQDIATQVISELSPKQEQLPVPAPEPTETGRKIQQFKNAVDALKDELGVKTRPIDPDEDFSKAIGEAENALTTLKTQLEQVRRGSRIKIIADHIAGYVGEVERIVGIFKQQEDINTDDASITELRQFLSSLSEFAQIVEAQAQKGYVLSEDVLTARDELQERLSDLSGQMDDIQSEAEDWLTDLASLSQQLADRIEEIRPEWIEEEETGSEVALYKPGRSMLSQEQERQTYPDEASFLDVAKTEIFVTSSVLKTLSERVQEVLDIDIENAEVATLERAYDRATKLHSEVLAVRDWSNLFAKMASEKADEAFEIVDKLHEEKLTPAIDEIDEVRDEIQGRALEVEESLINRQEIEAGQIVEIDGEHYGPTFVEARIDDWIADLEVNRETLRKIESGEKPELADRADLFRRLIAGIEADLEKYRDALRRYYERNPDRGQFSAALAYSDAQTGRGMRRAIDALGFYSQALEAAKALKQAKGTPEQMRAQLKAAGVRDAELQATGLEDFLKGKQSVTRDEIVKYLEQNRVTLKEVEYRQPPRQLLDQLANEMYGNDYKDLDSFQQEDVRAEVMGGGEPTAIWSRHSLDPENPTYRETVLRLPIPEPTPDMLDSLAREQAGRPFSELTKHEQGLIRLSLEAELQQRAFQSGHFPELNIIGHMQNSLVHLPDSARFTEEQIAEIGRRIADAAGVKVENLASGAPAIAVSKGSVTEEEARAFASTKGWDQGRGAPFGPGALVYLIDQIQSDWGQNLRDKGARDEEKIADLRRRISEVKKRLNKLGAWPEGDLYKAELKRIIEKYGHTSKAPESEQARLNELDRKAQATRPDRVSAEYREAMAEQHRLNAELMTAEAEAAGHPLVNTTDQWVNTTLRRAIRQAVEAGADYIAIPTGETVLTYNSGDERGMREFYGSIVPAEQKEMWLQQAEMARASGEDPALIAEYEANARNVQGIVPKNLRKLLSKLDKATPAPLLVDKLITPTKGKAGKGFTVFRLTDTVKKRVIEEGQAMFALLGTRARDSAEAERSIRLRAEAILRQGGTFHVPERVTQAMLDAASDGIAAAPRAVQFGAIARIRPNTNPDRHPEADVVATFRDRDSKTFDVELPLGAILSSRALYHRGANRILLLRFGLFENFGPTVSGEVWHEIIHALRRNGMLRGARWSRLLRHAASLRVLDLPLADYLRLVGSPGWQYVDPKVTLRNAYLRDYASLSHLNERMDEEAVAHLVELARHGYWSYEQLEPVFDLLDMIASGEAAQIPVPGWWQDPARFGSRFSKALEGVHFTHSDFDRFKQTQARDPGFWGDGVYFFPYEHAKGAPVGVSYGSVRDGSRNIPVVLDSKRPFVIDAHGVLDVKADWASLKPHGWPYEGAPVTVWEGDEWEKVRDTIRVDKKFLDAAARARAKSNEAAERIMAFDEQLRETPEWWTNEDLVKRRAELDAAANQAYEEARAARNKASPLAELSRQFTRALLAAGYDSVVVRQNGAPAEIVAIKPGTVRGKFTGDTMFSLVGELPPETQRKVSQDLTEAVNIINRIAGKDVDVEFFDTISAEAAAGTAQREATRVAGLGTGTAGGFYRPGRLNGRALIGLATNDPAFDLRTAAGHEAWHHVEEVLASDAERRLIRSPAEMARTRRLAAAEIGLDPSDPRLERLPDSEIRAIAFGRYRRMREEGAELGGIHIAVRRLWDRIIRVFEAVRNVLARNVSLREALAGSGSTEAIFERARKGELADRDTADLRGLRDHVIAWYRSRQAPDDLARYEAADTLEAFAATRFQIKNASSVTLVRAYAAYQRWANLRGDTPMSEGEFVNWLNRNGYEVFEFAGLPRIIGVEWTPAAEFMERVNQRIWELRAAAGAGFIPDMHAANDPFEDKYAEAVARQIEKRKGVRQSSRGEGPMAEIEAEIERVHREYAKLPFSSPERHKLIRRVDELRDAYDRMRGNKPFGVIEGGRADTDDTQASLIPNLTQPAVLARRTRRMLARAMNRVDRARVFMQDRVLSVRRLQEAIEEDTGMKIPLNLDVYVAEALYHGRAGERLTDLQAKFVEPLIERLRAAGLKVEQLGEYLYARHAIERNDTIRARDPQNDEGSGMSDGEARGILDRIARSGKLADYEAAAKIVDDMIEDTRRTLLRSGLIDRERYEGWRNAWRHYVPLRGFEFVDEDAEPDRPRIGRGFDIRGPEAFKALGRRTRADNPVVYAVLQAQQAIIRAEKNRVDKVLFNLIQAHPDPSLWKVYRGEYKRRLNPDTGLVEKYWVPPHFVRKENLHGVKIGGKQHYFEIKHPALARAIRGTGSEVQGTIIGRTMFKLARTYASLLTSWNPEFLFSNLFRDVQTALINVGDIAERPEGIRRKIVKEALSAKAIRGAFKALRGDKSSEYAKWFEEYRHAGGKISWLEFNDVERIRNNITKSLQQGRIRRTFRHARELVEDLNTAVENGVRLSVYKALRENGVPQDRAAFVSRELTVNFNRKGEWGPGINAAYLFFNASVQGTTRMVQAVARSKAVRYAVAGIFATGFALDMLNYLIAGEDDDGENAYDKIPDWIKERNLIIMLPGHPKHAYIQIPLAYGYNLPFLAGQQLGSVLRGARKPMEAAALVAGGAVEAFNPIGTATSVYQMVSPTLMDPAVQVLENKTWYGAPIYPVKYDRRQPWSETYFDTAPWWARETAKWLNSATGGSPGRPGLLDFSPDVLQHYAEFAMGGVGKFMLNVWATGEKLVTGDEWLPEQTPIIRRLYSKTTAVSRRREFFDVWNDIDQAYYEMKELTKERDPEGAQSVRQQYAAELSVYPLFKATYKDLRSLRQRRSKIDSDPNLSSAEKRRRKDELIKKENSLIIRAIGAYNRALKEHQRQ